MEDKRKKVHDEGYEVPRVSMRMENVDSEFQMRDFEQPSPSQLAFAWHHVRVQDRQGNKYIDGQHTVRVGSEQC